MTGKFPEYPDEDDGGSALLFKEKDPAELERELKEKVRDANSACGLRSGLNEITMVYMYMHM